MTTDPARSKLPVRIGAGTRAVPRTPKAGSSKVCAPADVVASRNRVNSRRNMSFMQENPVYQFTNAEKAAEVNRPRTMLPC